MSTRRLVGGSVLRGVNLVAGIAIAFYMYPFLVHSLGDKWYGFWTLAGLIVGYYGMLDLGLISAAHRFLSLSGAREDHEETSRVFTTMLVLFARASAFVLVLTGLVWWFAPWKVKPEDLATFRPVILLLGINFAISFPVNVFNGIIAANLRYDISSYLEISKLVARSAVVIVAIRVWPSILTLAIANLVFDVLTNAATVWFAWRLWPWAKLGRRYYDPTRVREYFGYGAVSFSVRAGDVFRYEVQNLIVGATLGVATVAHYGIAAQLNYYFQSLMNQVFGVLTPVFSRYHGLDDRAAMFNGVRQASRFAVAASASLAGAAVIFGEPFIARWMGHNYVDAYWPLVILVVSSLFALMQTPSTTYLFAVSKHKYYAALNGADALVNVTLSIILAHKFGMIGVALGTAIPTVVVKLYFQPRYVCRQLGYPVSAYWRDVGPVLGLTVVSQVVIGSIVWLIGPHSYLSIFSLALGLNAVHALVLYLFILPSEDQQVLARAIPRLNAILAIRGAATSSR